jgi:hypothetical protein
MDHLPMSHGVYNRLTLHGSWVIQQTIPSWVMECTTDCLSMSHRSYSTVQTLYKGIRHHRYISVLLHYRHFHSCDPGKLSSGHPCPPIPPVCFPCSISLVPWLFFPHLFSPHLPHSSHISEGPNCPFHLFCDNLSLLTPPLGPCPCP